MKGLTSAGLVVTVAAVICVPAGTAGAAFKDCGKSGTITDITADGVSCAAAKKVTKRWKQNCNYPGRCAVDNVPSPGEQWVCKGRTSGSVLKMSCTGGSPKATIRFKAPA